MVPTAPGYYLRSGVVARVFEERRFDPLFWRAADSLSGQSQPVEDDGMWQGELAHPDTLASAYECIHALEVEVAALRASAAHARLETLRDIGRRLDPECDWTAAPDCVVEWLVNDLIRRVTQ